MARVTVQDRYGREVVVEIGDSWEPSVAITVDGHTTELWAQPARTLGRLIAALADAAIETKTNA